MDPLRTVRGVAPAIGRRAVSSRVSDLVSPADESPAQSCRVIGSAARQGRGPNKFAARGRDKVGRLGMILGKPEQVALCTLLGAGSSPMMGDLKTRHGLTGRAATEAGAAEGKVVPAKSPPMWHSDLRRGV